jgi:hypothetical protein
LSCSAAENWKFTRPVTVRRCPPVFSFATIFGTVPVWCTAERTRPDDTAATPAIDAICLVWLWGKVSWVPGSRKVWSNFWPALPSFERSVSTEAFAWITWPPPPPPGPPPKPPPSVCGASVTVRSVPIEESGFSACFCAWSTPRESDEITITSATPIASPSSVRIVRLLRRRSSLRM